MHACIGMAKLGGQAMVHLYTMGDSCSGKGIRRLTHRVAANPRQHLCVSPVPEPTTDDIARVAGLLTRAVVFISTGALRCLARYYAVLNNHLFCLVKSSLVRSRSESVACPVCSSRVHRVV